MTDVLLLDAAQVRGLIDRRSALAAAREAFTQLSLGLVEQPDVLSMDLVERRGEVHAKGAYLHGADFFSIKVATGFYDNPARGLPVANGAVWVFDASTGALAAILLDNGYLTDLRTAAAGALAAHVLARDDARTALIVGAGGQARHQLLSLREVRDLEEVMVWARRPRQAVSYAREVAAETGLDIHAVEDLREALEHADIVVTTTPAREPLIAADWVRPGTHITAVGSDLPGKVELDPALLADAVVVADRLAQCRTQGEIGHALSTGAITEADVRGELGDVVTGKVTGRRSRDEITIADLTGVGALDAAVANHVTARAIDAQIGTTVATR